MIFNTLRDNHITCLRVALTVCSYIQAGYYMYVWKN